MERRIANQRQKSSTAIFLVIISVMFLMLVGLSFAYFSDSKNVSNTLKFGKLQIQTTDGSGSAQTQLTLTGNSSTVINELAPDDTVTITGTVGLEENSVSAYIRMKINAYEKGTTNEIYSSFNSAFMAEMAKIVYTKDSVAMQWFVVDDYMYLGNKIEATNAFVYSDENTNTNKNVITLSNEMVPEEFQGKDVDVKLTYQAIQSAGMKDANGNDLTLSGYTQENAEQISQLEAWMPFNLEEYALGTWTAPTHKASAMDARGTFNKGVKDANGKYTHIEFGTYPQTFYSTSSAGLTLTNETYTLYNNAKNNAGIKNDCQVYMDASGNKYVEITTVRSNSDANKYSDNTTLIKNSTIAYFKLEPIIWEIIGVADSNNQITKGGYDGKSRAKLLLNSVKELTAMKFGETNLYANSTIKSYLEGEFYTNAFTSEEKSKISKKAIVTTSTTDGTTDKTTIGNEDTNSTVFLLGHKDINTIYYTSKDARIKWPTDYAGANYAFRASGTANSGGEYWSRSPDADTPDDAWSVDSDGLMDYDRVDYSEFGVVPALFLNI